MRKVIALAVLVSMQAFGAGYETAVRDQQMCEDAANASLLFKKTSKKEQKEFLSTYEWGATPLFDIALTTAQSHKTGGKELFMLVWAKCLDYQTNLRTCRDELRDSVGLEQAKAKCLKIYAPDVALQK